MMPLFRSVTAAVMLVIAAPVFAAALEGSTQLVVVTTEGWEATQGKLQAFERTAKGWQPQGAAFDVAVGRSGSAWGEGLHPAQSGTQRKQEGDGRSPAGIFAIGPAFGYARGVTSGLPYQPMRDTSYCMDVPDSPYYNRIVDAEVVGAEAVEGSTEPMRLDLHNKGDVRYREGFVIEHNSSRTPGRGSCIFAHLWRTPGEATAGCTAMEPRHMKALLAWLKPDTRAAFILLPKTEYDNLQVPWQLPVLTGAMH